MDENKLLNFYQECMNINLSQFRETILNTTSEEERAFYVSLFNYILKVRQEKCIADGIF